MLKEITHFFSIYKDLEGKRVEMKGWRDAAYARDRVVIASKQFQAGRTKSHGAKRKSAV
jgi:inorganic pyrophosphatase